MALILASGSSIRRTMLEDAGVQHIVVRPEVDEAGLKAGKNGAAGIATALAAAKALAVSEPRPDNWVIGSDSVVSVDGRLFDKPRDLVQAREHLRFFSGRTLVLTSAVALARDGDVDWRHAESASLLVRPLSDEFINAYLDAEWPEVGHCVGVFRMEGRGVQLFDRVDGNYFTILGMPLIALLGALRERKVLPS